MILSLAEKISIFLKERQGRMYCDACIQERLGLKWRQQVQLVTATLAVTEGYAREFSCCGVCQIERLVTLATSDSVTPRVAKTADTALAVRRMRIGANSLADRGL
jgi:hypothetical protein